MTTDEQLDMWVNGQSVHNPTTNECCPDFSCCVPGLAEPMEKRREYVAMHKLREQGLLLAPQCSFCGRRGDLRMGMCFECAMSDENPQ